jgi:SAM-dependent methyltransferase
MNIIIYNAVVTVLRHIKIKALEVVDKATSHFVITRYISKTPPIKRKVILGGHWENVPGWLILNEMQQDITKKLFFPTNSINVIFMEHVFEHIEFDDAVRFLKEAKRVLRKNGVIRIISPSIEPITNAKFTNKKNDKEYIKNTLVRLHYKKFDDLLKSIGLKGVEEDPKTFFLNGIFRESEHKFIWSAKLLRKVMSVVGFRKANIYKPGDGMKKEYCLERKTRGISTLSNKAIFDKESLSVEAIK